MNQKYWILLNGIVQKTFSKFQCTQITVAKLIGKVQSSQGIFVFIVFL